MYISTGLDRRQEPDGTGTHAPTSPKSSATPAPIPTPTIALTPVGQSSSNSSMNTGAIVAIAVAIAVLVVILLSCIFVRKIRGSHQNPKYIPTKFLKKRWESWNLGSTRLPRTTDSLEPLSRGQPVASISNTPGPTVPSAAAGIDRNTSVRSVMTLPAYHPDPRQNERVLGREGERGGIDVVVEYPETADEVEARREEEMEALYQVRLARRRENEEREQRRTERREARERGDYVALREIQARARAASSANGARTVEELRRDVARIKQERTRAVSSVSYADLGVARHDGTRIRASQDSERQGLLGDAASIAASGQYHRRDRSTSSVLSIDTMSDFPSPGLTRSRADSNAESLLAEGRRESGASFDGAGSSPELISHDDIPPHSPPDYENIPLDTPHPTHPPREAPPEYASPVERTAGARFPEPAHETSASHHTSEEESHSSSPSEETTSSERSSSRGAAVPQLPSLHLQTVPSIVLDSPTPVSRRREGDDDEDFS